MEKLSKAQKDELATSFAILALYDGEAEISSGQISALLEATGNTEVEPFYPIIFANFLSDPEKVATLIASPGAGSGGKICVVLIVHTQLGNVLINWSFVSPLYQVVVAVVQQQEALPLKKKKRKSRLKKRKLKLVEAWTCSEEVMLVVVATIRSYQLTSYIGHGDNSRFCVIRVIPDVLLP
jgi:hypothetical protein